MTEWVPNPDESVYLPPDSSNPSGITLQFPTYFIPADAARFVYDVAGRMVRAENRDAIVIRSYFPGGALQTDSLKIRSWSSLSFPHVYGIRYGYDAYGRTEWLEHPSNLAGATSRDYYAYHPVTGALSGVTTRSGHSFSFQYDLLGRLVQEVEDLSSPVAWDTSRRGVNGCTNSLIWMTVTCETSSPTPSRG